MKLIKNLAIIVTVFIALLYVSCEKEALPMGYSCESNNCFSEEGGQYLTLEDCQSVCNNYEIITTYIKYIKSI